MSGKRYLLDTNAIVALLNGHQKLGELLKGADYVAISVISRLEFFSYSGMTEEQRELFDRFAERVEVVGLSMLDAGLLDKVCAVRVESGLKLPDAIVAATAQHTRSMLVTADQRLARYADGWMVTLE